MLQAYIHKFQPWHVSYVRFRRPRAWVPPGSGPSSGFVSARTFRTGQPQVQPPYRDRWGYKFEVLTDEDDARAVRDR